MKITIQTDETVADMEIAITCRAITPELEKQLEQMGFLRVGKSCILNLKHIRSLRADLDRRIKVTMENGEQLIVSRQYAQELKKRLGVK